MVTKKSKKNQISRIKFWILVALVVFCIAIGIYLHLSHNSVRHEIGEIKHMRYPNIAFIIFYTLLSFIPIAPMMFTGGFIFNFIPAVIYTTIASLIFSTIVFFVTRFLGRDYFESLESTHRKLKKIDLQIRHDPFENLLLLRLFFIIPPEIVNVYAGLTRIKYRHFILSTFIANTPLIICAIGLIRGLVLKDDIIFTASLFGLVVMLIIPVIFSKKIRNHIINIFKNK